ncbi:ABC transporter ATP-binding protein [Streptomyces sp. TG1A-8]|uniref:ABC transporter ATP-binding protein n=1 Tax=Streptomyces sp. TG1A-8 TaxID=3051385 RepID=UPI00265C12C0|nr:ABC transporter ATP-binding protein [Streptomyces sp. TG1A-8]MDO0925033.1 ABC transporter ATP-binding protein [Streptomyces sp. TG1A-8]
MMDAIVIEDVSRTYTDRRGRGNREVTALTGVSLRVPAGEVHGLLGPNGAGKTTLCRILTTTLEPTTGQAWVLGRHVTHDSRAVRRSIGLVFGGERGLYGRLSARENLWFWGAMYGLRRARLRARAEEMLSRVGLADRADARVDTLSRGMKQRLHLARGLVGDPRVLILDEPTVGMDPVAALDFRTLLGELKEEGRTVLLTTHDMAEAEAVCDRVSLIDRGRLMMTEDTDAVGRLLSRYERVVADDVPGELIPRIRALEGVVAVQHDEGHLRVETERPSATSCVLGVLAEGGVHRVSTARPGLEEVYLHLVGRRGMAVT